MYIKMNDLIGVMSHSLDIVEAELLGATTNHGKRIAVLAAEMGRKFKLNNDEVIALTTCALFHDNALTEYILSERITSESELNMSKHCIMGQRNIELLPFKTDVTGIVLYHHEKADGSGPFNKKEGEIPLQAGIIAIADMIDVKYNLGGLKVESLPLLRDTIKGEIGISFTANAGEALLEILDSKMLISLNDNNIYQTTVDIIPSWLVGIEDVVVIRLATFIAGIIDYKSSFTRKHSIEIANKIFIMCDYYKFDDATRAKAYLAAALHDIGKLAVDTKLLAKTEKLTDLEFVAIKNHVLYTHEALKDLNGLEDVCDWASNHHEKLDGSGYPFGKKADELDFISRLMVCIDIYQAVSEERPYHPARGHKETMIILYDMAEKGQIDLKIVKDIDIVMAV